MSQQPTESSILKKTANLVRLISYPSINGHVMIENLWETLYECTSRSRDHA